MPSQLYFTVTDAVGTSVSDRSLLGAISSPAHGQTATLAETGYEGLFVFESDNMSVAVAADPGQFNFVAPISDDTGASGTWVRKSGAHRRTATASVTSVHGKLRHIVFAEEDYGFTPGGDAAANAAALQLAINEAQIIHLPEDDGTTDWDATIELQPYTRLVGGTDLRTRLVSTAPLAFLYQAPDGVGGDHSGPQMEDFSLFCTGNGIRFNDPAGTFSDSSGQLSIMRPVMRRVKLFGPINDGGNLRPTDPDTIGVYWVKCFDGIIDQCEIKGFGTGYKSKGSDLCTLRGRTRISFCNRAIDVASTGSFGSGTLVDGADIIVAFIQFVRSSDKDFTLAHSYLEMYPAAGDYDGVCSGYALEFSNGYSTSMVNNRLELLNDRVASFLKITDDGQNFVFAHNKHAGLPWGTATWMAGEGALYWKNSSQRQQIRHYGNASVLALPFNSCDTLFGIVGPSHGQWGRTRRGWNMVTTGVSRAWWAAPSS